MQIEYFLVFVSCFDELGWKFGNIIYYGLLFITFFVNFQIRIIFTQIKLFDVVFLSIPN